ncbi:MAG: M56 family metallopeptidase, partial [Hyphomonas sp.]|nr:M56 family metallopeptidase [Hyphomonas sp.]
MTHAVLNSDFSHALETLLAVSVLILVVLMLRRPVARQFGAGVAYLLWAIPVVRLFLPPLPTPFSIL